MKKTLLLVRHATAEEQSFGLTDFDRQLNPKGLAEAEAMGNWVAAEYEPDIFISSTAPRAYQTAEIFATLLHADLSSIHGSRDLYDGGPRAYLHALNTVPENFEMLILFGHNPDITNFAEYLTGANLGSMKKAGVAVIDFEDQKWEEISAKTGTLVKYQTPKQTQGE